MFKNKSKLFIILLIFFLSVGLVSASDANESVVDSNSNPDLSADEKSEAFLLLDNDADKEDVHLGDLVTWEVVVANLGPDTAKNVQVYDQLPDGMEYVKHTTTKGTFSPQSGIWLIGDLAVDEGEVYLYITTKATSLGEKINKVNLTTDSINTNFKNYEEEEIDVEDDDGDDDDDHDKSAAKEVNTLKNTGNPLYLVLISLSCLFITRFKRF